MKIRQSNAKLSHLAASGYKWVVTTMLMGVLVGGLLPGTAGASWYSSCVHDSNTYDIVQMDPGLYQGTDVHYTVKTSETGSNKLTVKVQQMKSNGDWTTISTIKIDAGSTGTGSFTVQDYRSSSIEEIRFRLARDTWTSQICYDISLSY